MADQVPPTEIMRQCFGDSDDEPATSVMPVVAEEGAPVVALGEGGDENANIIQKEGDKVRLVLSQWITSD